MEISNLIETGKTLIDLADIAGDAWRMASSPWRTLVWCRLRAWPFLNCEMPLRLDQKLRT